MKQSQHSVNVFLFLQYADGKAAAWFMLVAFCIPVAPGRSRLIWSNSRNVGVWRLKMIPRWFSHHAINRILDSDISLVHLEVRRSTQNASEILLCTDIEMFPLPFF
jgi:hypothetical protein